MIKLLVTDVDGTLLCSDHRTLSQKNIQAVRRCVKNGVQVCIASGRGFPGLLDIAKELGLNDTLHIADNGATLFNTKGEFEVVSPMADHAYHQLIETFAQMKMPYCVYTSNTARYNEASACIKDNPMLTNNGIPLEMGDTVGIQQVTKVLCLPKNREEGEVIINSMPQGVFGCISGTYDNGKKIIIDCIPGDINKGKGILNLLKHFPDIDISEVACAGDSPNDLEMFQTVETGFAVKGAHEAVLEAASVKLESTCDESAVAEAIEKYILVSQEV